MRDVEVIKNRVLEAFLKRTLHRGRIKRLTLIAPWISDFDVKTSIGVHNIETLGKHLAADHTVLQILTRRPLPSDKWHSDAIEKIMYQTTKGGLRPKLRYNQNLHAKLYLATMDQISAFLLGSPNFTGRSLVNHELGMFVQKTNETRKIYQDIENVARNLFHSSKKT